MQLGGEAGAPMGARDEQLAEVREARVAGRREGAFGGQEADVADQRALVLGDAIPDPGLAEQVLQARALVGGRRRRPALRRERPVGLEALGRDGGDPLGVGRRRRPRTRSRSRRRLLGPVRVQRRVGAARRDQLVVGALLDDPAVVEDDDPAGAGGSSTGGGR